MDYFAYTEEIGQSGLKLLDAKEDIFWTGTVVSARDLDTKYKTFHQELLDMVGQGELRGDDLALDRIEKIASRLIWFIRDRNLRFSFVRIDKQYLAAVTLFDLAFNPEVNPAIPAHVYNVQQARQIMLVNFLQLFKEEDIREFWTLFEAQDANRLESLLTQFVARVGQAPFDARTKLFLTEGMNWAAANAEKVLVPFGGQHSPEFVASSALFQFLTFLHDSEKIVISSLVYEQQNLFISAFKATFPQLIEMREKSLAKFANVAGEKTIECPNLSAAALSQSFGLQLASVCLWLLKRAIDQQTKLPDQCASLIACLQERSSFDNFCFEAVAREVTQQAAQAKRASQMAQGHA